MSTPFVARPLTTNTSGNGSHSHGITAKSPSVTDVLAAARSFVVGKSSLSLSASSPLSTSTALAILENPAAPTPAPPWLNRSVRDTLSWHLTFSDGALENDFCQQQLNTFAQPICCRLVAAAVIFCLFSFFDAFDQDSGGAADTVIIIRVVLAVVAIAVTLFILYLIRYRRIVTTIEPLHVVVVAITLSFGAATVAFGPIRGIEGTTAVDAASLKLIGSITATMFHLPLAIAIICQTILIVSYVIVTVLTNTYATSLSLILTTLVIFIAFILTSLISYHFEYQKRKVFLTKKKLTYDENRTLHVLQNMLPTTVITQVKKHHLVFETYTSCSVLFSHITNFDLLTAELSAENIIKLLNIIFSTFDHLTDLFNVYKVETIGDVYLTSSNVPTTHHTDDHASLLSLFALAMIENIQSNEEIQSYTNHKHQLINLKIGIHTGGLIAGVVVRKYPRYRLMGDTINTASRMSTTCKAGHIQISAETYKQLSPNFICQYRGNTNIKGKGSMPTFFIKHVIYQSHELARHRISLTSLDTLSQMQADALLNHIGNQQQQLHSPLPVHDHPVIGALYSNNNNIADDPATSPPSQATYVFHGYNDDEDDNSDQPFITVRCASSKITPQTNTANTDNRIFSFFTIRSPMSVSNGAADKALPNDASPTHYQSPQNANMTDLPPVNRLVAESTQVTTSAPTLQRAITPLSVSSPSHTPYNSIKLSVRSNSNSQIQQHHAENDNHHHHNHNNNNNKPSAIVTSPMLKNKDPSKVITPPPLTKTKESAVRLEKHLLSESAMIDALLERTLSVPWSLSFSYISPVLEEEFYQRRPRRFLLTTRLTIFSLMLWMLITMIYTSSYISYYNYTTFIQTWIIVCVAELIGIYSIILFTFFIFPTNNNYFFDYIYIMFIWIIMSILQIYVLYALDYILTVYGIVITAQLLISLLFFVGLPVIYLNIICTIIFIDYIISASLSTDDTFPIGIILLLMTWLWVITIAFSNEYYRRIDFLLIKRLEEENILAKQLANEMLPQDVMLSLSLKSIVYNERQNASVLYCDIVGFTAMASNMNAADVVTTLSFMFSTFDALTSQHDVYKVETIGDAYLACSGVVMRQVNHTLRLVRCAQDFQLATEFIETPTGLPIRIRIGIHTGSLVAGVVGTKMPRYHLFGQTVTIAEEMEQHGTAGRVEVSENTYEFVQDEFEWEEITPLHINGICLSSVATSAASTVSPSSPVMTSLTSSEDLHHTHTIKRYRVRKYIGHPNPYVCHDDDEVDERLDRSIVSVLQHIKRQRSFVAHPHVRRRSARNTIERRNDHHHNSHENEEEEEENALHHHHNHHHISNNEDDDDEIKPPPDELTMLDMSYD